MKSHTDLHNFKTVEIQQVVNAVEDLRRISFPPQQPEQFLCIVITIVIIIIINNYSQTQITKQ